MKRKYKTMLDSLPQIDYVLASQMLAEDRFDVPAGWPQNWPWLVAMHDAVKKIQETERYLQQLQGAFGTFKIFFNEGHPWPGALHPKSKSQRQHTGINGRPLRQIDPDQVAVLKQQGKSYGEIAKSLGLSRNTIVRRRQKDPEFRQMTNGRTSAPTADAAKEN